MAYALDESEEMPVSKGKRFGNPFSKKPAFGGMKKGLKKKGMKKKGMKKGAMPKQGMLAGLLTKTFPPMKKVR